MKDKISPCGLICAECPIFKAHSDKKEGGKMLIWLKEEGRIDQKKDLEEFMEEGPYCEGCLEDGKVRWHQDCQIRRCCINHKGLDNCGECEQFPCDRLIEWSNKNEATKEAIERLKELR